MYSDQHIDRAAAETWVDVIRPRFAEERGPAKPAEVPTGQTVASQNYPNFPARYSNPRTSGLMLTVDPKAPRVDFDMTMTDR